MRIINIKNILHTYIQHVLIAILLLSFYHWVDAQPNDLFKQAALQQQKMIEKYGLVDHPWWQQQCDHLIDQMQLNRFDDCLIIGADFANAYSLAHGVLLLTKGLLLNINNSDQLAHIMAHEHAHLELNHHQQAMEMVNNPPTFFTKSRLKKFYRKIEHEADEVADEKLDAQQKDAKQIHHYLIRIESQIQESSSDHQKISQRIVRKNLPPEWIDEQWQSAQLQQ